jgi:MscS family membrane protein
MLETDDRVYDQPVSSRFSGFGDDAIMVTIISFIRTTDFDEFRTISEDLNFKIMEIVSGAGAHFALPSKSVYLERQN